MDGSTCRRTTPVGARAVEEVTAEGRGAVVASRARLAGAALALATSILDELPRLDRDLVERLAGDRHGAQRCVPLAERDRDGTDQTDVLSAELGGAAGGVG